MTIRQKICLSIIIVLIIKQLLTLTKIVLRKTKIEMKINMIRISKKDYDKNKEQSKPKSLYIKEITPNISLINLDIVAEGKHLKGIFDSGSNFNFINEKFYKTLENVSSKKKENIIITTANQNKITIKEISNIKFTIDGLDEIFEDTFYIFPNLNSEIILGNQFAFKNNIILNYGAETIEINRNRIEFNTKDKNRAVELESELLGKVDINSIELQTEEQFNTYLKEIKKINPKKGEFPNIEHEIRLKVLPEKSKAISDSFFII
ncbi:hypothetical protein GVAV_001033 [Gurleya vavrai]